MRSDTFDIRQWYNLFHVIIIFSSCTRTKNSYKNTVYFFLAFEYIIINTSQFRIIQKMSYQFWKFIAFVYIEWRYFIFFYMDYFNTHSMLFNGLWDGVYQFFMRKHCMWMRHHIQTIFDWIFPFQYIFRCLVHNIYKLVNILVVLFFDIQTIRDSK